MLGASVLRGVASITYWFGGVFLKKNIVKLNYSTFVVLIILIVFFMVGLFGTLSMIDSLSIERDILMEENYNQSEELYQLSSEVYRIKGELADIFRILYDADNKIEHVDLLDVKDEDSNELLYIEDIKFSFNKQFNGILADMSYINMEVVYLKTVVINLDSYVDVIVSTPSIAPCKGVLSSPFGIRRIPYKDNGSQFHTGVDIQNSRNTEICSTANGVVTKVGYMGSYGNIVIIDHGNGYETLYAHLNKFIVNNGDVVERGQVIGYMGATGRTTGTHLHYEVRREGRPINPLGYIN